MRNGLMVLVVLALTLMPLRAMAQSGTLPSAQAAPVSYSAIPGRPAEAVGSLLQKIQGYECKVCRRDCVLDFKIDCYASDRWCRRQFVRCMRECWEIACR